ncbi:MAG: helix-turn-helix domain-containing protein [Acidobacteriia bacterium]|nr:helix-turn-helix domain-containing protein [Terriglobia bacterium]
MEKRKSPRQQKNRQLLRQLLRQAREEIGMIQDELSRKMGRSQGFVSKYELGDRRIDVVDMAEVCDALGISFLDLAKRFDQMRKTR